MESSDLFPLEHKSSSSVWLSALVSGHVLRAAPHPSIRQKAQPGFNLKAGRTEGWPYIRPGPLGSVRGLPHLLQKAGRPGGAGRLIA